MVRTSIAALALSMLGVSQQGEAEETPSQTADGKRKPGILFINIDDLNDWTGPLKDHPQARTPNLDKLAERGVTFSRGKREANTNILDF